MLTKIKSWLGIKSKAAQLKAGTPLIIPRQDHPISRKDLSRNAVKVLYKLKDAGYQAYLVGGGIRDLLLGQPPKDFDVATDAKPEEVRKLFRNCRLIGRRFRLAHIYFGDEIIEVATFRANHTNGLQNEHGMLLRDNVYGSIEDDVLRRDFTINAIYYNIHDFSLVDYVGGIEDIKRGQLRIIGEANARFREDPVRMLRAIRFASKLQLRLHPATAAPMPALASLLESIAPARLFEEYLKLFLLSNVEQTFTALVEYGLFAPIFPQVTALLPQAHVNAFIAVALQDTDRRLAAAKPVSAVFLLAVFLWYVFLEDLQQPAQENITLAEMRQNSSAKVFTLQRKTLMIPKSFTYVIRDIWLLQFRLGKLFPSNVVKCYKSEVFRMAYDFLLLRARSGDESVAEVARWWQAYVEGNDNIRRVMLKKIAGRNKR